MASITLKPTSSDDLPFLLNLWNDGRVMKWVEFPNGVGETEESIQQWFRCKASKEHFHHFIVLEESDRRCGEVCFDLRGAYAGLDIKLRPDAQGKGIGTKALKALINRAFEYCNECKLVWTEPSLENTAARRLYTRCGLQESPRPAELKSDEPFWSLSRDRWLESRGGYSG